MILHLVEICILRKELRKMLRCAERIKICKYNISLNMSWICDLEVFRICIHAVHLLLDLL